MSEVQVRFPSNAVSTIRTELARWTRGREPVVFGLASSATTSRHRLILVRELIVPPEDAFLPSAGHGARWKGAYMIELLNPCLENRLGLFVFHSHGAANAVCMSSDDRESALALLPKFQQVFPSRPHGSIVFGRNCAAGMILMPGDDTPVESFSCRFLGTSISTVPRIGTAEELLLLERQPLTASPATQRLLAGAVVAVVGLSGGGSQVVPHLAALGVGTIIGIDPQRLGASNRHASSRVGWFDALLRRKKTANMRRAVRSINRKLKFVGLDCSIPEPPAVEAIKSADIVVGCVNNLHARSDLLELCWRYCIPYVDIGLALTVRDPWAGIGRPPLTGIHGNVFVAVPGGPCMRCTDFLTDEKLNKETGGRGRAYLRDGSESDAWVLSFNGVLASQAASDVLQLLAGYSADGVPTYRRYDGMTGTMLECAVRRRPECVACREALAAGDVIWT